MIEQHNSMAEKFLRKWFWLYIFSFIIAPIWYIIKIILSGDLEVSEIWIIYWVMSLMVLLSSFNDFWMTESMNKFIPQFITQKRYDKVKTILFYSFIIQIFTWIIIFFIFIFWANYLWYNYFKDPKSIEIIQIFAFFFLWTNIFSIITTFFSSVQNTFLLKIVEFLRMTFILLFTIYLFYFDLWNIVNYSYAWIWGLYFWIIITIIIFYFKYYRDNLKWEKLIFEKSFFNSIFKYAIIALLWSQIATILSQVDMQMIIYFLWTTDAWYYSNYLSIISIPFMIIWPIFSFLFPVFSELHSKWEKEKIILVKSIMNKTFLSFWIAFNILFFIYAKEIAYILFWEKFITSWEILMYSILFLTFNFMIQINFNVLAWIWKITARLYIMIIALIINIILNFILIKEMWVVWRALATWIVWVYIWIASEFILKDYFTKFDYIYLWKNILFLWIIWFLLYKFSPFTILELTRMQWFYTMFIIWIIFFIFYILINLSDFKYFINEVKKLKNK